MGIGFIFLGLAAILVFIAGSFLALYTTIFNHLSTLYNVAVELGSVSCSELSLDTVINNLDALPATKTWLNFLHSHFLILKVEIARIV